MATMNPITVSNDLIDTYYRYIMTRFPLGKTNPKIRKQFKELLYSDEGKKTLIKGPILEIMPPFKKGSTFRQLSKNYPQWKPLAEYFEKNPVHFPIDRELFRHQEQALIKSMDNNIIVASGTGSGKTECFLLPIIRYCLENQGEGVRAILIYPLNALVEDQIERLSRFLAGTAVTFGKYTGQTPRTEKDAEEKKLKKRCPNHLLTRTEMRSTPPNILITNYAMLEYMLIRPGDSHIIDLQNPHTFRFIVLDEVHSYAGAAGTEVAYLLRRLRHRVGRTPNETRYIGTSATLGSGEEIQKRMIKFARRLFGAPFSVESVISGAKENLTSLFTDKSEDEYSIQNILQWGMPGPHTTPEEVRQKLGITTEIQYLKQAIYKKLIKNKKVREIIETLTEGPKPIEELAKKFFPGAEGGVEAIVILVAWADYARKNINEGPSLLPARYHMFVSATKGIFCELEPDYKKISWKHLALSQKAILEKDENPYPFELEVCRICGEAYIMGVLVQNDQQLKYKPMADTFFEAMDSEDEETAKVILHPGPENPEEFNALKVCRLCGDVSGKCLHDEHHKLKLYRVDSPKASYKDELLDELPDEEIENESELEDKNQKRKTVSCINCNSGKTLAKYILPLRLPANGSTAPLVSKLFSHTPEMDDEQISENVKSIWKDSNLNPRNKDWTPLISKGRKLLLFSDSRQEAAYFGPYMQISHNQMAFKRLMIDILPDTEPLSVEEWKERAFSRIKRIQNARDKAALFLKHLRPNNDFMKEMYTGTAKLSARIYHAILHLIDADASSLSGLEGIGIGAVYCDDVSFASELDYLRLSTKEIQALTQLIVRHIRLSLAFHLSPEDYVYLSAHDAYFSKRFDKNLLIHKEDECKEKSNIRLISRISNPSRIQRMIRQCIARFKKIEAESVSLDEVNEVIARISSHLFGNELKESDDKKGHQLDITKLYVMPANNRSGHLVEQVPGGLPGFKSCRRCGRLSWIDLNNMCSYPDCFGELTDFGRSLQASQDNHYRSYYRYENELPELRAVEHTAQLDKTTAAKDYQKEFKRGRINTLSCSTTFEMGVDLGDLSTVLMRNVPPGIANYVQRAGRAGRREGISPFVLTFCRSLPHDQYYFNNYDKLVIGNVTPPAVVLENEKILVRHFNAVVLADFLKEFKVAFANGSHGYIGDPKMSHLFDFNKKFQPNHSSNSADSPVSPSRYLYDQWWLQNSEHYKKKIAEIFLQENDIINQPFFNGGLDNYISNNTFISDERYGLEKIIEKRYKETLEYYESEQNACNNIKIKAQRDRYDDFDSLINQAKKEHLISHLSSRGLLPSYAFPTNVVPLKILSSRTDQEMLDLNRCMERAISEYAPGAQIVANSKIYTIDALHKFPRQVFKTYYYSHCKECNWFAYDENSSNTKDACRAHINDVHRGVAPRLNNDRAVCPEWGFAVPNDKKGEDIKTNTILKKIGYTSELYIDTKSSDKWESVSLNLPKRGTLTVTFANGYDIIRVNRGKKDEKRKIPNDYKGFKTCKKCGRNLSLDEESNKKSNTHETPYGANCKGKEIIDRHHLISIFDTDVVRLTFHNCHQLPDEYRKSTRIFFSFWRSVLYAFIEAVSHVLEIERNDISGLYIPLQSHRFSQLVLIDSVSGGAGHVARLAGKGDEDPQALFNEIIKEAVSILNCNECADDTACYSCLFHHSNQNIQHTLNRGLALEWLSKL